MENNYLHILARATPPKSGMKSKYVQHCYSSGRMKKGGSYIDSNPGTPLSGSSDSLYVMSEKNNMLSGISGIYEIDSKLETTFSKGEFSSVTGDNINTTMLRDIDPSTCFTDSLYEEFLDFFISYSGEHEVFSLLLNYEELCSKHIEKLKKVLPTTANMDNKFNKTARMLRFLQEERNTWRLLRILFQDRINAENMDEADILMDTLGKKLSDKQLVEHFYQSNSYIRQSQLIIDWLEKNAADDFQDTFYNKFDYFTDNCLALEHSLNDLTTKSDLNQNRFFSDLEMDPDAHLRQKGYNIHETDKENESRLFKYVFVCIRAGNLSQAQVLAERFGEPWLAAALEGWRLSHDPNYSEQTMVDGQELLPIEGNKYRDIWKAACWAACQAPCVSIYEQAVYGSLCGNLRAMLAVCKTWEDFLWAYMRSSHDKLVEKHIRSATQQDRPMDSLPVEYWDKILDIEEIFQELEASESDEVKLEGKSSLHIMQKFIILDNLDGLIEEMYDWLGSPKVDGHVLRNMVHLILFLRVVGRSSKEELCVPVLEAYVQELIKGHKISLVAPYTSTLPKEQQIIWYSKFLEGIKDNNERQQCLQYAEDAGLDVIEITKTVVKNIREKDPVSVDNITDLSAVTTADDLNKINAIDWLIFDQSQRSEAVKQANSLMRVFVAQRKIEAAKQLFSKVPSDSIAVMMAYAKAKGLDDLLPDDDNATREYLCFKAYLEAMDAFNNWFHHSIHAKPREPVAPTGDNVSFKEKVAYEHELSQHQKDLERWRSVVTMLGKTASDCLYNVLLFVNGGWMVDQRMDGSLDEFRQFQMSSLRKLCLPHITRLLQDLLISEERHKEAVQLADIISSERYQLYKEFNNEDLKQFLSVTLDSSFALLDKNFDPLGYEFK